VGARWSSCTRMPTDVSPARRCPTSAAHAASSHSATTRGVASTGTSPDAIAHAVSASPTTRSASPHKPGSTATVGTIRRRSRGVPAKRSACRNGYDADQGARVIEEAVLQKVIGAALRHGGDFAEVFAEDRRASSAALDDGKVEELSSGRDRGAGIRVVVGETTGYAHTSDLSEGGLLAAAEAASAAARGGTGGARVVDLTRRAVNRPNEVTTAPESVAKAVKVELLKRADAAARAAGASIVQVSAAYGDSRRRILVANSDGLLAEDDQVKTLFRVSAVASGDTGMQTGYESVGHPVGFELFDRYDVEELARKAAERALLKLRARPAPSGRLPVVIKSGG